jgi:succinate-acetate transporter protein
MIDREPDISCRETGVQPRVILQPIAAPSILGLYGFAAATFIVAAYMAGWFGSMQSTLLFLPFAAVFGGLAQFLAGMWAFKARDGLATAVHGMWGSFWMAFGLIELILSSGRGPFPPGMFAGLGYWFIVLAAITWVCMVAAWVENAATAVVLAFLAAGSTLAAIGLLAASHAAIVAAGYLLVGSAVSAWYTASAMVLKDAFGREVLGMGKTERKRELGSVIGPEPGVIHGQ